jgi:TPR repeat protein
MRIIFFSLLFSLLFASTLEIANQLYDKKKYKEAFKLYQKNNSIIAKNNRAMMYYYGQGVKPDQAKAINILENLLKNKKLTKQQKSVILYNLGMMYYYGYINNFTHKLIVDRKKAKKLIKESANLGYKPAEIFYKNVYEKIKNKNKEINASKKK